MRIVARRSLRRFVERLRGKSDQLAVSAAIEGWHQIVERADWSSPADLKRQFAAASIVGPKRVVFNFKGNDYRLVVAINYRRRIVFVKWFGSHVAYDKIDVRTVNYEDQAD